MKVGSGPRVCECVNRFVVAGVPGIDKEEVMNHIITRGALVAVIAVFGLSACSDDAKVSSVQPTDVLAATTDAPPTEVTDVVPVTDGAASAAGVVIEGFAFSLPASVTAGQEFSITNNDGVTHTFSDVGGSFSVNMPSGSTNPLTIDTPGTYNVVCQIHASMKGTLVVK